jgi:hypothetical protein
MSDSDSYGKRASAPDHPEAERIGEHLVIDKAEWVPGEHPESHRGHEGQTAYRESFIKCLRCRVEVMHEDALPETCTPEGQR